MKIPYIIVLISFCLACTGQATPIQKIYHKRAGLETTGSHISLLLSVVEIEESAQEIEPVVANDSQVENLDGSRFPTLYVWHSDATVNRILYDDIPIHIKIRSLLI